MKNIWTDDANQNAIDLDQVRMIYLAQSVLETGGHFSVNFDFIAHGFTHIVIQRYGPCDESEAEDAAAREFAAIVQQWMV